MKAVLISIQPKWCEKIASGEKTIEVRKTRPKIDTPFKCYIYRTTERVNEIVEEYDSNFKLLRRKKTLKKFSGEVIGEFVCYKVNEYIPLGLRGFEESIMTLTEMCLSKSDLDEYGGLKPLYGWHISNLKIYDKPKDLGNFIKPCIWDNGREKHNSIENCKYFCGINRPPQSWCYVEELEVEK